jgi:hypothetical protein
MIEIKLVIGKMLGNMPKSESHCKPTLARVRELIPLVEGGGDKSKEAWAALAAIWNTIHEKSYDGADKKKLVTLMAPTINKYHGMNSDVKVDKNTLTL